jgi:hypothetical protein
MSHYPRNGGPERTRISDLYPVKVLRSVAYKAWSMETQDFHVGDLDKWAAGRVWTSRGLLHISISGFQPGSD